MTIDIQKRNNFFKPNFIMKKTNRGILLSLVLLTISSCEKDEITKPTPESAIIFNEFTSPLIISTVTDLRRIDLDKDETNDILFSVRTSEENLTTFYYYVAEPLREDVQIMNTGLIDAFAFPKNSTIFSIPATDLQKRWTSSLGVLLEKSISSTNTQRIGMFNGSQNLYLGIRIKKNQEFQYGWVEIKHQTESTIDKILITKSGINKQHTLSIKAGDL